MSLKNTRAIIDAIHATGPDSLGNTPTENMPVFNVAIPRTVPGVPTDILTPSKVWADKKGYEETVAKLANMFKKNFDKYAKGSHPSIAEAGPKV
jgi:phosphoenolpyruvate carboxykinase (ATP)